MPEKIIGIGGVSRSGKSFLAKQLAARFEKTGRSVKTFDQDDFVFPERMIPTIRNHLDWERPESIDFQKLKLAISNARKDYDIVIAEGLMVFSYPDVFRMFNYTIFIKLDREEFLARKRSDLRWGREPDWYIDHIWEGYLKYGQYPKGYNPNLILDGNDLFDIDGTYKNITKG